MDVTEFKPLKYKKPAGKKKTPFHLEITLVRKRCFVFVFSEDSERSQSVQEPSEHPDVLLLSSSSFVGLGVFILRAECNT